MRSRRRRKSRGAVAVGLAPPDGELHALRYTGEGRVILAQRTGVCFTSDGGRTPRPLDGRGDAMAAPADPRRREVVYRAGHGLFLPPSR